MSPTFPTAYPRVRIVLDASLGGRRSAGHNAWRYVISRSSYQFTLTYPPMTAPGVRSRHREEGKTFVPLDPATVQDRLCRAGFADAAIDLSGYPILVSARKRTLD